MSWKDLAVRGEPFQPKSIQEDSIEVTCCVDKICTKKNPFMQRAQHHTLISNAGNKPLPKATSIKQSTKASTEEDAEQPDQDRYGGQSPPLEDRSEEDPEMDPEMLLQPDTRPISHEQLVVEVKGIYAGLAMVEAKCIEIDERQLASAKEKDLCKRVSLQNHQWESLIALHRQLIFEHHDFLLASQHPSASPALRRLATKYSIPARLWRHGIHSFLEVLRYRLPDSLEQMLAFIYIAFSMVALFYETVSTFEDTWIECLGDLGRYRMAIGGGEPKDREVWCNTSRYWYEKAVHKSPNSGRLYHHLAILARPAILEQLSLFTRSLTCVAPFEQTRESIMTLFNPILRGVGPSPIRPSSWETILIRAHAILFTSQTQGSDDNFDAIVDMLVGNDLFDEYVVKSGVKLKEFGAFAAISNVAALFEYGAQKSRLRLGYKNAQTMKDTALEPESCNPNQVKHRLMNEDLTGSASNSVMPLDDETSSIFITRASILASDILELWLHRETDSNIHPLVHVYLVFVGSLIVAQEAWKPFEKDPVWEKIEMELPWYLICRFLNTIAGEFHSTSKIFAEDFPQSSKENGDKEVPRPLPEDFTLRGQMYSQWYFPSTWFRENMVDDEEQTLERPSTAQDRIERILWLGHRIASVGRWIRYDVDTGSFILTDYVTTQAYIIRVWGHHG